MGKVFSGKIMLVDALSMNFSTVELSRNEDAWRNTVPASPEDFLRTDYEFFCGNKTATSFLKTITVSELQKILELTNEIQLLDVREPHEQPQIDELIDLQIPLAEIKYRAAEISETQKVIVFCKAGTRSKRAIELLESEFGFTNLYNLEGGVTEWTKHYQLK